MSEQVRAPAHPSQPIMEGRDERWSTVEWVRERSVAVFAANGIVGGGLPGGARGSRCGAVETGRWGDCRRDTLSLIVGFLFLFETLSAAPVCLIAVMLSLRV